MNDGDMSVVICTRNRPESLRSCLESILRTELRPLEVLVVDQSNSGHTLQLVRRLVRVSPFPLRCLRLDSVGHTKARNAGLEASRGSIVAFTDDDCIVHPAWLGALCEGLGDSRVNCVCGRTEPASHVERPGPALLSTLRNDGRRILSGKRNPVLIGRGNNMAFRRDDLLRLGGFNEQIGVGTRLFAGDDIDVFYRLLEAGGSIAHAPDAVVFHAQPDDWRVVVRKKGGYSVAVAAILVSRLRRADLYAGVLLAGKILYELVYLLCGGALRMNRCLAAIGWHSLAGSLSGLRYFWNSSLCDEICRLSRLARETYCSGAMRASPSRTEPCGRPR